MRTYILSYILFLLCGVASAQVIEESEKVYSEMALQNDGDYRPQVRYINWRDKGGTPIRLENLFRYLKDSVHLEVSYKFASITTGIHPLQLVDAGIWFNGQINSKGELVVECLSVKQLDITEEEVYQYLNRIKWSPALMNLKPVNCQIEVLGRVGKSKIK